MHSVWIGFRFFSLSLLSTVEIAMKCQRRRKKLFLYQQHKIQTLARVFFFCGSFVECLLCACVYKLEQRHEMLLLLLIYSAAARTYVRPSSSQIRFQEYFFFYLSGSRLIDRRISLELYVPIWKYGICVCVMLCQTEIKSQKDEGSRYLLAVDPH